MALFAASVRFDIIDAVVAFRVSACSEVGGVEGVRNS